MEQTTRPTRRPRAGLLALAVAAVLAAGVVAISYWRFWAPKTDATQSADAMVILGGEAEESTFPSTLAAQGWVPNLGRDGQGAALAALLLILLGTRGR